MLVVNGLINMLIRDRSRVRVRVRVRVIHIHLHHNRMILWIPKYMCITTFQVVQYMAEGGLKNSCLLIFLKKICLDAPICETSLSLAVDYHLQSDAVDK